jgi:MYXO-CTERM domain-containing protein
MSTEDSGVNGTTPEEIEAEIARQREELAATVTELHARLDVKARTKAKAAELRGRATTPDGKPDPRVVAAAVAVVVLAGVAFWRRHH